MVLKHTKEDKELAEKTVNEKIVPFIEEIDKLIEENSS